MNEDRRRLVDWDNLRLSLLFCYEGAVPTVGRGMREVTGATAWLLEQGWAQVRDERGESTRAQAGQWLMVRPGLRQQEFSPDARLISINFRATFFTGESLFDEGLSLTLKAAEAPQLERKARALLREVRRELAPEVSRFSVNTLVNMDGFLRVQRALLDWVRVWAAVLAAQGLRPGAAGSLDARVSQAVEFLQSHVREEGMDMARVAEGVGLSASQLTRIFLRERGETPRQFHQRYRKEHAHHLLMRTGLSIKEVAAELGFKHASHFTAWFRKHNTMTPSQFRSNPVGHRYFPGARVWELEKRKRAQPSSPS